MNKRSGFNWKNQGSCWMPVGLAEENLEGDEEDMKKHVVKWNI